MYIAMNRFRVNEGHEDAFENRWRERETLLHTVPGFREFHLLRGATEEGTTLYASHVVWDSREAFVAWTESDEFRRAHATARSPQGTLAGPPRFEGFEVVL